MNLLTIYGSHGEFRCDADTGVVLTPKVDLPEEYRCIRRVDVGELQRWARERGVELGERVDVLVVGYWHDKDGTEEYEAPEAMPRWQQALGMESITVKLRPHA